jgi:putative effector of murein hydrolase LrgA (UPF0299 family)
MLLFVAKGLIMMKKPFSIRVEQTTVNRFKAISTIENIDGAALLSEMILDWENKLKGEKKEAYEALLRIWGNDDVI